MASGGSGRPSRARGKPSIAVLPFDNLGGDEATGRLADGITEDIITDLARFRDLAVIARNSTGVYRGKPVDIRAGRHGSRCRATCWRARSSGRASTPRHRPAHRRCALGRTSGRNAGTGHGRRHLRGPDRDRRAASPARSAATGLLTSQDRAAAKRKRPADLEAYDLWAFSYEAFLRRFTRRRTRAGAAATAAGGRQRIRACPGLHLDGLCESTELALGRRSPDLSRGGPGRRATGHRARSCDAEAHAILGEALGTVGDCASEVEYDQALELNPSSADILNLRRSDMSYFGKPERGAEMCDRVLPAEPEPTPLVRLDCFRELFLRRSLRRRA